MEKYTWYHDILHDHYYHPRNKGSVDAPSLSFTLNNPACGDSVTFSASVENGILTKVHFEGAGCVMSQATASLLTEKVIGLSGADVRAFGEAEMQELVGIPVGPVRMKCVMLPLQTLQKGLEDYARSNNITEGI